ncbi:MAG: selenocysteine-specific translation elongation factor [Armatimonadota bacterium]|nr:selenocysteine-specific translation elongation factor [Armatimonadota bacterium]
MRPVTIGTAGHIDHGKSALVRALTGIDPDRLAEEQRRGMTLDLGFAHLDLPGGRRVGIVDVPGHEALIHNMLAGAAGIDLVILVVAADEGVMPQTREHVDILGFLGISGGVIVLNKIDLVTDPEWLVAVEEEVRNLARGTVLEQAPTVHVSTRTGEGLPELIRVLDRLVAGVRARPADGPARLPVDRAFTMQGFGTVVTGTLWSGTVQPGDVLVVLPPGREVRVRGVQVHGATVERALAGSRVAVNLAGIEKDDVRRGDVLATPGAFRPTDRLEVSLRLLPASPSLKDGAPVHLHLGSGSVIARVRLPHRSELGPGEETVARLRLDAPIVAVHGDRFVVRRYSPTHTLGGGIVLNVAPGRRRPEETGALPVSETPGPLELVITAVAATRQAGLPVAAAASAAGVDAAAAAAAIAQGRETGRLVARGDRLFARSVIDAERQRIEETLQAYHRHASWRRGLPREELKSRIAAGPENRVFDSALADLLVEGRVVEHRGLLALAGFEPGLSDVDRRVREAVLTAVRSAGVSPPPLNELRKIGPPDAVDRALVGLLDDGAIVAVGPELRFATEVVERVRALAIETIRGGGELTVATLRDRLQTSRRYALALLEYFDSVRVTRRVGDRRVLGPQADAPPWAGL